MTVEAWSPQLFPRANRKDRQRERPKPRESLEPTEYKIFSGERFEQLRRTMEEIVNINLSLEIRNLAVRAGEGVLQLTEGVIDSFRTAFTVPLALWDSLNMQLINSGFRGMDLSEDVIRSTFVHSFRTNLSYCLALRRGATEEEAFESISDRITARIAALKARELDELSKLPIIYITNDDIAESHADRLRNKLALAVTRNRIIQVSGTTSEEAASIRDAVISTLTDMGVDVGAHFREVSEQELTPFEFLKRSFDTSNLLPEQARIYENTMSAAYEKAQEAVFDLDTLYSRIAKSRALTNSEKRQFIIGIMRDLGAPIENIRTLLRETRYARRESTQTFDYSVLLNHIAQTQAALEMISPTLAMKFAETVAGITGATPEQVAAARAIFQRADIQMFAASAVRGDVGSTEGAMKTEVKEKGRFFFRLLGVPDPGRNPLKFCRYIEARLRDQVYLQTFAFFHAIPLALITDMNFMETWSITRRLTWLQQLTAYYGIFAHLSIDKRAMQEGIFSKLPFVGKGFQSLGDILPEWAGIGLQPPQVTQTNRKEGRSVTLAGGGPTFQGTVAVNLDFRDASSAQYVTVPRWVTNTLTGKLELISDETIRYKHKEAVPGSDISEDYYKGGLANVLRKIAVRANADIASTQWMEMPWLYKRHGYDASRSQEVSNRELWHHGWKRIKWFLLPLLHIYKKPETEGIKTKGTEGGEVKAFADFPRETKGSHLLGVLMDYWGSFVSIYLDLLLIKYFDLQPTFGTIAEFTDMPLIKHALEYGLGLDPNIVNRIPCLNPILAPIHGTADILADSNLYDMQMQLSIALGNLGGRLLEKVRLKRMKDPRLPLVESKPGTTRLDPNLTPGVKATINPHHNHLDVIKPGSTAWESFKKALPNWIKNGKIDRTIVTGITYPTNNDYMDVHTITDTLRIPLLTPTPSY